MGRSIRECGGIWGIARIADVGSESPIISSYSFTASVEIQWTVVVSCPVLLSAFCILHSVHPVSCRLVIPPIFYSLQYRISQIHWICITHPSLSLHVCIEYGDAWQFQQFNPLFISHGCRYRWFCPSVSISKCLLWCFYFNLQLYPWPNALPSIRNAWPSWSVLLPLPSPRFLIFLSACLPACQLLRSSLPRPPSSFDFSAAFLRSSCLVFSPRFSHFSGSISISCLSVFSLPPSLPCLALFLMKSRSSLCQFSIDT